MASHTTGPWTIYQYEFDAPPDTGAFYIGAADGSKCIAHRPPWPQNVAESQANARLIAAAPEMLEALLQVEAEMRAGFGSSFGETREQIRRAIAKAEGATHA